MKNEELAPRWTDCDEDRACAEGWMLVTSSLISLRPRPGAPVFTSEASVVEHLQTRANHGDTFAARALNVHYMDLDYKPPKTLQRCVATVHLVLPASIDEDEALDYVTSEMTDNLVGNNSIEDWGYVHYGGHWLYPTMQFVHNPDHPDFPGNMLRYENDAT